MGTERRKNKEKRTEEMQSKLWKRMKIKIYFKNGKEGGVEERNENGTRGVNTKNEKMCVPGLYLQ
jgi:hypothetical protein